jgi:putative transposase
MDYPSNVSDKEWLLIMQYFTYGNDGNRSRYKKRDLVNAVFYVVKSGCQWRMLPHDFPPWKSVYSFYKRAKDKGIWEEIMRDLVKNCRLQAGRASNPSYSIIDSQSVKTTGAAESRGIDGGKKIKGHKRHIVTDTQGHLLHVKVHAANIHDTVAGCKVFEKALMKYPSLNGVCADAGYRKTMEKFVTQVLGKTIEISERITHGWVVIAKRWIVERTFAWLNHYRRLSKDYEICIKSAENMIMIAHSRLLLTKLCNP